MPWVGCCAWRSLRPGGRPSRLALVLEFRWWCGEDGMRHHLTNRVYGDASATVRKRGAATLAR
jgi:hypothetical protein